MRSILTFAFLLALPATDAILAADALGRKSDVVIRIPAPRSSNTETAPEEVAANEAGRPPLAAKRLEEIRITEVPPAGELPPDRSVDPYFGPAVRLDGARDWYAFELNWSPTNLAHKTLYFDDVVLEHYGQSPCPAAQPVLSAGHFFATLPVLPARLLADPPCAAAFSSYGHARPGSPARCLHQRVGR